MVTRNIGDFRCLEGLILFIGNVFVDNIFKNETFWVFFYYLRNFFEFLLCEDFSCRVMGGVDEDDFCFMIDRFLEEIKIYTPSIGVSDFESFIDGS